MIDTLRRHLGFRPTRRSAVNRSAGNGQFLEALEQRVFLSAAPLQAQVWENTNDYMTAFTERAAVEARIGDAAVTPQTNFTHELFVNTSTAVATGAQTGNRSWVAGTDANGQPRYDFALAFDGNTRQFTYITSEGSGSTFSASVVDGKLGFTFTPGANASVLQWTLPSPIPWVNPNDDALFLRAYAGKANTSLTFNNLKIQTLDGAALGETRDIVMTQANGTTSNTFTSAFYNTAGNNSIQIATAGLSNGFILTGQSTWQFPVGARSNSVTPINSQLAFQVKIGDLKMVDVDIDSDNNDGLSTPAGTTDEELIEADQNRTGKFLSINDDDSDGDEIPDFADGFSYQTGIESVDELLTSASDHFVPITFTLPDSVNPSIFAFKIDYSASDPNQLTHLAPDNTVGYTRFILPENGQVRLWTRDGATLRTSAAFNSASTLNPELGYFVPSSTFSADDWQNLLVATGSQPGSRTVTLWMEAVKESAAMADVSVEFSVDPNAASYAQGFVFTDIIRATAPRPELVTRYSDTGAVASMPGVDYTSDPRPEVKIDVVSAAFTADNRIRLVVNWEFHDPLSGLTEDLAYKVQTLKFVINGATVQTISPYTGDGGIIPLWQPYANSGSGSVELFASLPADDDPILPGSDGTAARSWSAGAVSVYAETGENALGYIGWDKSFVVLNWEDYSAPENPANPTSASPIYLPDPDGELYGVAAAIDHIENIQGSSPGSFYPFTYRIPFLDDQTAAQLTISENGQTQEVAGFTFSPRKHYIVKTAAKNKPQVYVVTTKELPAGLSQLRPQNLDIGENGGKVQYTVRDNAGNVIADTQVMLLDDTPAISSTPLLVPSGPVTEGVLFTYYKLIYGDVGLRLLEVYQKGGNRIELGDVLGDLDLDGANIFDEKLTIQVEEDTDPISAAGLLYQGLKRALAYPCVKSEFTDMEDFELLKIQVASAGAEAANITAAVADIYLSLIGVVSEGADWVMTISDVSEGNYAACVGLLPLVSGRMGKTANLLIKKLDGTILHQFSKATVDVITEAASKITWADQFSVLKKLPLIDRKALANIGLLRVLKSRPDLRAIMETAGKHAPEGMLKPEVQHDFPWVYQEWFVVRGIDIHDPAYMRWVEQSNHRRWTHAFQKEWDDFMRLEITKGYTEGYPVEMIIEKMNSMRGNPDYQ